MGEQEEGDFDENMEEDQDAEEDGEEEEGEDEGFSDLEDEEGGHEDYSSAHVSQAAEEQITKFFHSLDKNKDKSLEPDEILPLVSRLKEEQRLPSKFDEDHSMS